jgi:epoxyqueuosine reductase
MNAPRRRQKASAVNRQHRKGPRSQTSSLQIIDELFGQLDRYGCMSAMVPIERLTDLKKDIYGRHRTGQFAPELFEERYRAFDFEVGREMARARSIIIVAAAQPYVRLGVTLNKRRLSVVIPPTYSMRIDAEVEKVVRNVLEPAGHSVFRRSLPLKLLAVRSGLARYGRNNLAYVQGAGSYCRLVGLCTSLPVEDSTWSEPQPLDECEKCVACINKCPTSAIGADRFLVRAERCLTFHNERRVEFPTDLRPEWHHCIIGCLYCQSYCPVNRKVRPWIEDFATLDERDTAVLLNAGPAEAFGEVGRRFVDEFDFSEELPELARNLKALLDRPANIKRAERLLPGTRAR